MPQVSDLVFRTDGKPVYAKLDVKAQGNGRGRGRGRGSDDNSRWELAAGGFATVYEVDQEGDFKLMNDAGQISVFIRRAEYTYKEQPKATFAGFWRTSARDEQIKISGSLRYLVHKVSGDKVRIQVNKNKVTLKMPNTGDVHEGELVGDDQIKWSNGDEWNREAPAEPEPLSLPAESERLSSEPASLKDTERDDFFQNDQAPEEAPSASDYSLGGRPRKKKKAARLPDVPVSPSSHGETSNAEKKSARLPDVPVSPSSHGKTSNAEKKSAPVPDVPVSPSSHGKTSNAAGAAGATGETAPPVAEAAE
jgi:hypothetical protein